MEGRNESIVVLFPELDATQTGSKWEDTNGYLELGIDALYYVTEVDLTGWAMNDFTFGTLQTQYQDPGVYSTTALTGKAEVVEIISDVPLSEADLIIAKDGFGSTVPGMMGSNQNFATIIYGNYRLYVPNASLAAFPGFLQMISSGSFGSKEPTAAERLYCYRIVKCLGVLNDTMAAPACRIGLFGAMFQEEELSYIMRLKRSYELQQRD